MTDDRPEPPTDPAPNAAGPEEIVRAAAEVYLAVAGGDVELALLIAVEDVLTLRRLASFGLMRGVKLHMP
jgi:hypothetical protein